MDLDDNWVDRIARRGEVAEEGWVVHKLRAEPGELDHMIFCPACQCGHGFDTVRWLFNGDYIKPTLSPQPGHTCSVLIQYHNYKLKRDMVCHFHLTDGMMQFCGDCTHEMAGKSIALEPF